MPTARLRATWELLMPYVREAAGLHEFDGRAKDLSPEGVRSGLERLGGDGKEPDAHDEAHLAAAESGLRTFYGLAEEHRWNPMVHLANLDLTCYDRPYAPAGERMAARSAHAGAWPDAITGSIESLDRIPAPIASCLLGVTKGLAAGLDELEADSSSSATVSAARSSLARLVAHVEKAESDGPPEAALGAPALSRRLGDSEDLPVDLGRLEGRADAERSRLWERLTEDCGRLRPGTDQRELVEELKKDHPEPEGIYAAATAIIGEATAFTLERDLLPELGGSCLVGPAPPSRRYAMAMMSWPAPYEADAPAWYYVTPPDESWDAERREEWLSVFSATSLPSITVHEVTPGHFAHGLMLGRAEGDVRRSLYSSAFIEGWAHYAEELMVDEGFRSDDPRFAIGVWLGALVRVTRFAAALGIHGGSMSLDEATDRFERDAMLAPAAAASEAQRALYDPTYGRYTWGKLEILRLRDEATAAWGRRYSHRRFHDALLALGAPPLGTMGDAVAD